MLINSSSLNKLIKNKVNIIRFKQDGKMLNRIEDKKGNVLAICMIGEVKNTLITMGIMNKILKDNNY